MYFSDQDMMVVLLSLHIVLPISLGIVYAAYKVYRVRQLTFALFEARDDLIRCVATGSIKAEAPIFVFFYRNVVSLIQATNTDFFSFRNFLERLRVFENDEMLRQKSKRVLEDLSKQKPEFQQAVAKMVMATQDIMLEKNLFLRILVKVVLGSFYLKKIASNLSNASRLKVEKRTHYEEYKFLENIKTNLSPQF